jgi:aryl-alcohol dehydrogenase-like predicted oxidoreductase
MRRVNLPGAERTTSALGYGCSQLMARIPRAESIRLLEVAFDSGITHFDTARSYGYGEAESALGDFLRGRRDHVTVATKLGLEPPRRTRGLALAKSAARAAVAVAPPLRALARRGAATMVKEGRFAVPDARASLETSLRELGTGYVDLLLLHECEPDDLSDELLAYLQGCVDDGKVRAFGIATQPAASGAIAAQRPDFAGVVQIANGVTARTVDELPELWRNAVVTHSALARLDEVARRAPDLGRREVAELMLAWAALANPDGIVLFSSSEPGHIRRNAQLSVGADQRARVEQLAAGVPAA